MSKIGDGDAGCQVESERPHEEIAHYVVYCRSLSKPDEWRLGSCSFLTRVRQDIHCLLRVDSTAKRAK